jgi:hypothetical protein
VVNLKGIKSFGDDPRRVMRHELAHAVSTRARTISPDNDLMGAPLWAVEGFAAWTEGTGEVYRRAAAGSFKGRLPTRADFYGKDSGYNYAAGCSAFAFVERIKGREATVEFYESIIQYTETNDSPLADLPTFNAICTRVLKMSATDFKQRWADFVRTGS